MAKKDNNEPWNSKIQETQEFQAFYDEQNEVEDGQEYSDKKIKKSGTGSTVFLTFLVAIMFAIIGAAIIFTLWNSRKPNLKTVESNFYSSGRSVSSVSSSSSSEKSENSESESSESGSSTSESSAAEGNTYTVIAGDYPSLIADKAGVSWEEIVTLNPTLDAANPGYYKDGSQLTAGQTLIITKEE
ncbi:MAG: SAG1386/EF1546 family surface-associated protein [Lactovum sp.]